MSAQNLPNPSAPCRGHAHLAAVLPLSRTCRYEVVREPDFPRPIRLTANADPDPFSEGAPEAPG